MVAHDMAHCFPCEECELKYMEHIVENLRLNMNKCSIGKEEKRNSIEDVLKVQLTEDEDNNDGLDLRAKKDIDNIEHGTLEIGNVCSLATKKEKEKEEKSDPSFVATACSGGEENFDILDEDEKCFEMNTRDEDQEFPAKFESEIIIDSQSKAQNLVSTIDNGNNQSSANEEMKYSTKNKESSKTDSMPKEANNLCKDTHANKKVNKKSSKIQSTVADKVPMHKNKSVSLQSTKNKDEPALHKASNQKKNSLSLKSKAKNLDTQTLNNNSQCYQEPGRHVVAPLIKTIPFKSREMRCRKCDYRANGLLALRNHVNTMHFQSLKCNKCDFIAKTLKGLRSHKMTKCPEKESSHKKENSEDQNNTVAKSRSKVTCNICNFICCSKNSLNRHFLLKHMKVKKFKCSECDLTFGLKQTLQNHIDIIHNRVMRFKCNICEYKAPVQSYMHAHITKLHKMINTTNCYTKIEEDTT